MSNRQSNNVIWNYFDKDPTTKLAVCNCCQKPISYKTTITNLKVHLKLHSTAYSDYLKSVPPSPDIDIVPEKPRPYGPRSENNKLWKYFRRDRHDKIAECNTCQKKLSYRTTITNLKQHLKIRHLRVYYELLRDIEEGSAGQEADGGDEPTPRKRKSRRPSSGSDSNSTFEYENNGNGDSDTDSPPDVWTYFEKESMDRARCVICRQTLGRNTASLTDHMKEKHAKLAVDIHAYDQNSYTEYVYLEDQDPIQPQQPEIRVQKPPERKPVVLEYYSPPEKKTTHTQDSHTQETRSEDGIDLFGKYVTNLLRDFPKDACIKVQGDIISLIIAEKLKIADPTPTQNGRSSIAPVILAVASEHLMPVPSSSNEQTIDNVATDKVPCIP